MYAYALRHLTDRSSRLFVVLLLGLALTAPSFMMVPFAYAATTLPNRYDKMSSSDTAVLTDHLIGFDISNNTAPIGSISFEFCGNTPVIGDVCVPPVGFDISTSSLVSQSGETGFSILAPSSQNLVILSRPAQLPSIGPVSFEFNNVLNPSIIGSFYLRIQTYTAIDATGLAIQEGGVALSTNDLFTVQTTVPPHLTFCASVTISAFDCSSANSYFIDFGEFSEVNTKFASSQMVAATNAEFGYSIFAAGTTFTSGNNTIPTPNSPSLSIPGTSQFGINLRANSQPLIGDDAVGPGTASPTPNYSSVNRFMYNQGDTVASATQSQDWKKYTVSYIVNIGPNQAPGVYSTTMTYICLANF